MIRVQDSGCRAMRSEFSYSISLWVARIPRETPEGGWVPEALFIVSRAVTPTP